MNTGVERRRAPRLSVSVPVRTPNHDPGRVFGVTRDVSPGGLYIYTESERWKQGSRIQFVFEFPKEVTGHSATTVCSGTVLRTERVESLLGIAVRIDRISFRDEE